MNDNTGAGEIIDGVLSVGIDNISRDESDEVRNSEGNDNRGGTDGINEKDYKGGRREDVVEATGQHLVEHTLQP